MTAKTSKSITTSKPRGKGSQPRDDSEDELDVPHKEANSNGQEAPPTNAPAPGEGAEAVDNRSLEEILSSIPPPPPPAMTNEPGAPRLMITHIVNQNFKSYAGEQILGPFHKGEVEQIAMMKPKGQTEHEEGMLEYLEDIIGSCCLKQPIYTLRCRVELLNEQRGEKLNRVKMVEKEKTALEGEKNIAVEFLTLENDIFKQKSQLCQYYVHNLQKRVANKEEKQRIQDDTKELAEKNTTIAEEMEKNQDLKNVEKKQGKLTKYIEFQKEKFTQLDLQDVEV